MRVIVSNVNDGIVVEDFYINIKESEILLQILTKGYVIYDYNIEKETLKVRIESTDIKHCGSCNRKIEYSETYYILDNQDEVCSDCHELYLGDYEGE